MDDSSEDQSIRLMMDLKEKDSRIHVSQNVFRRGSVQSPRVVYNEMEVQHIIVSYEY